MRPILNKQTNAAVLDPNIQQRFADLGVVAVPPNSPNEFANFIAKNIEKWTKVIKFAGIKPQRRRSITFRPAKPRMPVASNEVTE